MMCSKHAVPLTTTINSATPMLVCPECRKESAGVRTTTMTTANEALKPCGCGGVAFVGYGRGGIPHFVRCVDCLIETPRFTTAEKAAEVWNRALSAPPPAVAPQGWQPIETAPRDGTAILIWLADEGFCCKALWRKTSEGDADGDQSPLWWIPEMDIWTGEDGLHQITHWMPHRPGTGGGDGSPAGRNA